MHQLHVRLKLSDVGDGCVLISKRKSAIKTECQPKSSSSPTIKAEEDSRFVLQRRPQQPPGALCVSQSSAPPENAVELPARCLVDVDNAIHRDWGENTAYELLEMGIESQHSKRRKYGHTTGSLKLLLPRQRPDEQVRVGVQGAVAELFDLGAYRDIIQLLLALLTKA